MIRKNEVSVAALRERIDRNGQRLREPYYQIDRIFQPVQTEWPGDLEGRALLSFVSHWKMTHEKIPCMEQLLSGLLEHLNERGYLGPVWEEEICEQQLSGHSWLLRGLCEHYEQFGDELSLGLLREATEHLFLPLRGRFGSYPVDRSGCAENGGVGGHTMQTSVRGWRLSTDVGCAFMSIDGLSHVFQVTGDERVKELTDEMIEVYASIDKATLKAQTHCTLTAGRGCIRMYFRTHEEKYLNRAKDIFRLYTEGKGMDLAFHNLNWWGRPDTWTEPCAIVDSLMLAGQLFEATGEEVFRRTAARIYLNGFATIQRPNGGAGTDSVVYGQPDFPDFPGEEVLYMKSYEAPFCCTMRLAEGLWYASEHRAWLFYETEEDENGKLTVRKDENGRFTSVDLLLAEPTIPESVCRDSGWTLPEPWVTAEGHALQPIIPLFSVPDAVATSLRQRICFGKEFSHG